MSEDPKVSQTYRALGQEEPPREVDEAILAASRRAASTHPAPLVAPTGRRRWYFPVAAAAVVMLAAGVALHVERDQADVESASVLMKDQAARQEQEMRAPASAAPAMKAPKEKKLTEAPARREQEMHPPAATAPAPPPSPVPAPSRAPEVGAKAFAYTPEAKQEQQAQDRVVVEAQRADEAARDRRASSSAARPALELGAVAGAISRRGLADQPPEKWLETITELRKAGQHEEADKLLEEFHKRFPDQKVPDSALRK